MRNIIHIEVYKSDNYYIAEGLNLPLVTQGKTLDEVIENVKEAVELTLEGEKLSDFDFSENPQVLVNFELPSPVYA